ncbi:MAG TPA: ester cyclase [Gammaproteobacteria bacterium]|nr:ester cyclase [Gammaproteobacteria bacterium]
MRACRNRRLDALAAGLLTLATLAGCGDHGASAAQADKRRAADYLRTFLIERDWQRWPEYVAPNATLNGSDLALQIMRGTAEGLNFSFADLKLTIREQVAEPQRVATAFVLEGVHERPFNDQPPTHRRLTIDGFAFDRFEGGKIVESRLYLDVWGLSQRAAAAAAK